jgi:hypothetical protein
MTNRKRHPASFKDPAGFIFIEDGRLLRQVNLEYSGRYTQLRDSGLLTALWEKKWLLHHQELPGHTGEDGNAWLVLDPEQIAVISYPYEWSFDMLKDAALHTLDIALLSINHGMVLKDASSFNIQFINGRPVFIDSLSFDIYDEARPWDAYRQFCQHFLFPLLLNHYTGLEAQQLLQLNIDGVTADVTSRILPFRTRFRLGTALHVHLQKRISANTGTKESRTGFSKAKMLQLLSHLKAVIQSLEYKKKQSGWSNYYQQTILSDTYLREKEQVFDGFLDRIEVRNALDLGTNTGHFANRMASRGITVTATDLDARAINELYRANRQTGEKLVLPLVVDLFNPSPGVGWNNKEREPFLARANAELVLALALIHHLYFTGNIPMGEVVKMLAARTTKYCITEMVLPGDEKVLQMSRHKQMLLQAYTVTEFESCLADHFQIVQKMPLTKGERIMYLLKKIA